MPGTSGIRVSNAPSRSIPTRVLIITGYGSFDTRPGASAPSTTSRSPFDCDQVRRLVQVALGRRAVRPAPQGAPEQLLSTLSHELRTPLNVIMGYSAMLRDEGELTLTTDSVGCSTGSTRTSTNLLGYVETMLYVAELDRGVVPVEVGAGAVRGEASRALGRRSRATCSRQGARLAPRSAADLVIASDGDKLFRLVRTLADNAVRFTAAGAVVLVAWPGPDGITIEIRDTGPGLARGDRRDGGSGRRALRGEPPRHLGFGLRLAGRLVRVLGGSLRDQSLRHDVSLARSRPRRQDTLPRRARLDTPDPLR